MARRLSVCGQFGKKAACVGPLRSRTRTLRKYSGVHLLHADNRHMQRQLHGCGIRRAEKPAQDSMSGTFRMTYLTGARHTANIQTICLAGEIGRKIKTVRRQVM